MVESVLIEIVQRHSESLNRLRKGGVRLAVQKFGSGYSSLDYLRLFRVARLKIDQRFVRQATTCPDDAAVVRATVSLARELGIPVVSADGVETAEQRDFLIAAGCKAAQGHFFGAPAPAAALTDQLRKSG
jgi:EAL domain-containing protein (putative c-di-GMP-specific phosphodiesterase class I)